ncbi:hypothetical protein AAH978_19450 [Streptomyces sp. ZYX-F-203]
MTSATRLIGPCVTLHALRAPCRTSPERLPFGGSDPRLQELVSWSAYDPTSVATVEGDTSGRRPSDEVSLSLVVVNTAGSGQDLPIGLVKRLACEHLGAEAEMTSAGGFYLTSVGGLDAATRWIRLLSMVGLFTIALAAGLGALGEFLRGGRELAPLGMLTGRHTVFLVTAVWSFLLPCVLAVALGVLTSVWPATPIQLGRPETISLAALAPMSMAALCGAVLLAAWGAVAAASSTRRWRPVAD